MDIRKTYKNVVREIREFSSDLAEAVSENSGIPLTEEQSRDAFYQHGISDKGYENIMKQGNPNSYKPR